MSSCVSTHWKHQWIWCQSMPLHATDLKSVRPHWVCQNLSDFCVRTKLCFGRMCDCYRGVPCYACSHPQTTPGMCLVTQNPTLWRIWSTDLEMFETMCGNFKLNLSQSDLPVCNTSFVFTLRVPSWQGASLHHCKWCNLEGTDQICTNMDPLWPMNG